MWLQPSVESEGAPPYIQEEGKGTYVANGDAKELKAIILVYI